MPGFMNGIETAMDLYMTGEFGFHARIYERD